MVKFIIKLLKKVVVAIYFIYAFNLVASGLNIFIPINIITIGVVTLLGMCGLLSLIAIYFVLL